MNGAVMGESCICCQSRRSEYFTEEYVNKSLPKVQYHEKRSKEKTPKSSITE